MTLAVTGTNGVVTNPYNVPGALIAEFTIHWFIAI